MCATLKTSQEFMLAFLLGVAAYKIIEHQNGPTPTQNLSTDFVDPKITPLLLRRLSMLTFNHNLFASTTWDTCPPSHEWSFHSMTFHQLTLKLEASKFPRSLPVVPTRISPPTDQMSIPKKPRNCHIFFWLHCRKIFPKNHHDHMNFEPSPHQGHRTQDAEDSHIEAALLDLFCEARKHPRQTPTAGSVHLEIPKPKTEKEKHRPKPPIFGFKPLVFRRCFRAERRCKREVPSFHPGDENRLSKPFQSRKVIWEESESGEVDKKKPNECDADSKKNVP